MVSVLAIDLSAEHKYTLSRLPSLRVGEMAPVRISCDFLDEIKSLGITILWISLESKSCYAAVFSVVVCVLLALHIGPQRWIPGVLLLLLLLLLPPPPQYRCFLAPPWDLLGEGFRISADTMTGQSIITLL